MMNEEQEKETRIATEICKLIAVPILWAGIGQSTQWLTMSKTTRVRFPSEIETSHYRFQTVAGAHKTSYAVSIESKANGSWS